MACLSPLKGYRGPGGIVKFTHVGAWVDRHLTVACGQCRSCRLERSRQWAVRCMHEAQLHEATCFITLTYDAEHLPPRGTLRLEDWQKFAKRLRKARGPFRFYHCGEYGDVNGRPHIHSLIFGLDFIDDQVVYDHKRGNTTYTSPQLTQLWGQGLAIIGTLTYQSAAYVARYIMKKHIGEQGKEHYLHSVDTETGECHYLKPEYTTMSRCPGIGSEWFAKYSRDVYPDDFVITQGKKARPPKFYDGQYELQNPEGHKAIKLRRKKAGSKHAANNTPERLRVRAKVLEAKISALKRSL